MVDGAHRRRGRLLHITLPSREGETSEGTHRFHVHQGDVGGFFRFVGSDQHVSGYVLIAANEAGKASNITLVDVKAVGAFGRLTLAGREGDVEEAAAAAMRAIDHINSNARLR